MIDFIKIIYEFNNEGFVIGYFVTWEEHIKFILIHQKEKLKIEILICFHTPNVKYRFELFINDESIYEKKGKSKKDIMLITDEIKLESHKRNSQK